MTALFRLLRACPGSPDVIAAAMHGAAAGALVADAARHGLSGLVRHALDEARVPLPPEPRQALHRQAMGMAAAALNKINKVFMAFSIFPVERERAARNNGSTGKNSIPRSGRAEIRRGFCGF